jgi:hypothetical protein
VVAARNRVEAGAVRRDRLFEELVGLMALMRQRYAVNRLVW